MAGICPTAVANTTAHVEESDGRAAIAFTTTSDVAEVRGRVALMADMYSRRQTGGHGLMMYMGAMDPSAMGPSTMGPGAMGASTMGPGAMGPGAMGPSMMGSGAMGSGAMGTGAMGTGAMGTGAMGPGAMGTGAMGTGAMGPGMPGGIVAGGMMMPPSTARSEEIEGGARLVLTPRDPAQLAILRQHTQQMAAGMAARQCPVMEPTSSGAASVESPRQSKNP